MSKLLACLFAASMLFAQVANAASDCESQAVSQAGKPARVKVVVASIMQPTAEYRCYPFTSVDLLSFP